MKSFCLLMTLALCLAACQARKLHAKASLGPGRRRGARLRSTTPALHDAPLQLPRPYRFPPALRPCSCAPACDAAPTFLRLLACSPAPPSGPPQATPAEEFCAGKEAGDYPDFMSDNPTCSTTYIR